MDPSERREPRAVNLDDSGERNTGTGQGGADGESPDPESDEEDSYALPLGLAYFATPVVFGVPAIYFSSINQASTGVPFYAAGALGMLAAPAIVHGAYGNGAGAVRAIAGTGLSMVGGGLVTGGALALAAPCSSWDSGDQSLCKIAYFMFGGVIGAGIGYLVWGIVDTAAFAHTPRKTTSLETSRLRLTPTVAPILNHTEASQTPTLQGLTLGVHGQF